MTGEELVISCVRDALSEGMVDTALSVVDSARVTLRPETHESLCGEIRKAMEAV